MFSNMNRIYRWLCLIAFLFVILACYFHIDLWVAEIIHQHKQLYQSHLLHSLTILGSWPALLALVILLYIFCRIFQIKQSIRLAVSQVGLTMIICDLIVTVLKILLGRARPLMWFDHHLYGFYGPSLQVKFWSFPSGHAVAVMSIIWSLSILYSKYMTIWLLFGCLIVSTRILLLQHYISDVFASIYLAMIVAVFVGHYRNNWKDWL